MVFTAAELNFLFSKGHQMALSNDTCDWLYQEVMVTVYGFEYFNSNQFEKSINNPYISIPVLPSQLDLDWVILSPLVPPIPPWIVPTKYNLIF